MLRDLPVRDLMVTDVLTFTEDQNVQHAMWSLVVRSVDGAPVVDLEGKVAGVLSVADLIVEEARLHFPTIVNFLGVNVTLPWHDKELDESVSRALGATVGEVMTTVPITIHETATVEDAATLMHDKRISRVPVVGDDGRLVGIITRTDILRAMVKGLDEPRRYDAGDEAFERYGEAATADIDQAAREHRAAVEEAQARRSNPGSRPSRNANADEAEFGADVGRI